MPTALHIYGAAFHYRFKKVIHTPQQQFQAVKNKYQYWKKKIGTHLPQFIGKLFETIPRQLHTKHEKGLYFAIHLEKF
jgi:hypothetical protein